MTDDQQYKDLTMERNSFERQALDTIAENEKLKAQLLGYKEICESLIGGGDDDGVFDVCVGRLDYELLCEHHLKTPEQCLNSVKADAIDEMCDALSFFKLGDGPDSVCRNYSFKLRG